MPSYVLIQRNIFIQVVNKALKETAIGRNLLEEYEINAILKPESRRVLVRLIVGHIQEHHG